MTLKIEKLQVNLPQKQLSESSIKNNYHEKSRNGSTQKYFGLTSSFHIKTKIKLQQHYPKYFKPKNEDAWNQVNHCMKFNPANTQMTLMRQETLKGNQT